MSTLPRKRGWHRSYQELFNQGDLFLVEGSHMREQLAGLGCPREKVQIQRIGVDLSNFTYRPTPSADEQTRILMCGRFVEKKGFEDGIRAFARILPEFPKAQLRILGDGVLRPRIVQLMRDLGVEDKVELLGIVSYDVYAEEARQAHLFMAPSVTAANGDSEGGAPTVLLEMQARGIPVLSTLHADIPEVVSAGASGLLVPEGDNVALSEKLAELLAHPEGWDQMGKAGRAHMERQHDVVTVTQELERKYDAVRATRGGA
jgi:colanic acid/amylovoran biosynthesis glycosyltransferase